MRELRRSIYLMNDILCGFSLQRLPEKQIAMSRRYPPFFYLVTTSDMYSEMLEGPKIRVGVYIASSAGDQMYIFNSKGILVNSINRFPAFSSYQSVALDYDHDGDCDIARIAGVGNCPLQILLNKTGFYINTSSAIIQFASWMPAGVSVINDSAIVDIDGDGDNDITIVADSYFYVLKNDGSGTLTIFTPGNMSLLTPGHVSIKTGDLNNDGYIDAVIGNSFPENPGLCMINNGNGTFTKLALPINIASFYLFDIDFDGDLDIVCQSDTTFLRILKNEGNANFIVTAEVPGITSVGSITIFTYKED